MSFLLRKWASSYFCPPCAALSNERPPGCCSVLIIQRFHLLYLCMCPYARASGYQCSVRALAYVRGVACLQGVACTAQGLKPGERSIIQIQHSRRIFPELHCVLDCIQALKQWDGLSDKCIYFKISSYYHCSIHITLFLYCWNYI